MIPDGVEGIDKSTTKGEKRETKGSKRSGEPSGSISTAHIISGWVGIERICWSKIDDFRFLHPPCTPVVSVSKAPNSWVCSGSIKNIREVKVDIFSTAEYFYVSRLFRSVSSNFFTISNWIPLITRWWIKMQLMWDLKLSVNIHLT